MTAHDIAPLALDGAWIEETRAAVAAGFGCGVCLDFGRLDGLGPCPHCDPDGYAEHVFYALRQHRRGLDGADPWAGPGWGCVMSGPQVDIRVTGEREHCELAISRMREVFQLTDITGPVHARYSWPQVHVLVTAWLVNDGKEASHRDDRG